MAAAVANPARFEMRLHPIQFEILGRTTPIFWSINKAFRILCAHDNVAEPADLVFSKVDALNFLQRISVADGARIPKYRYWTTRKIVLLFVAAGTVGVALFLIPNTGFILITLKVIMIVGGSGLFLLPRNS